MNKNDLGKIRKQLKLENSFIEIKQVFSVYLKRETQDIIVSKQGYFVRLSETEQDMYIRNFKKLLTGGLNVKIFELDFTDENEEDSLQPVLYNALRAENIEDLSGYVSVVVERIRENYIYDTDVVVNFIRFEYSTEEEVFPFIMCSVNKTKVAEKELLCDFVRRDFNIKSEQNPVINLKSPMDGFMFPVYEDNQTNIHKILNYHSKPNATNTTFITDVLSCELILTAKEEKDKFIEIMNRVIGEKIKPDELHELYRILNDRFDGEEDMDYRKVPHSMLSQILTSMDFEMQEDMEEVFRDVIGSENYELTVDNIIPDFSKKSIEIKNYETELKTSPDKLDKIKQVRDENGNMYILMEISENMKTEGFNIETDEVRRIRFE